MTALVFPGQGSQFIGMAKDFYNEFDVVKEIFQIVENTSKIKIREIIFEDNFKLLNLTQYTQLAIFCVSISIYRALLEKINKEKISIKFCLGHSLGEYTALVASNVITIEECSSLLKIRGNLMQNSFKENLSGMSAIIGLSSSQVEKIIHDNSLNVEIANDNSPIQVVISGIKNDLYKSENIFKKNGAKKFVSLNVSAAFHSKIMKSAENKMKSFLENTTFKEPIYSVISNFSSKDSTDPNELLHNLINQMSNKVRWVESIKCLENLNELKIIEIGPGSVLSGLIKRISKNFTVFNINSIEDLNKLNEL